MYVCVYSTYTPFIIFVIYYILFLCIRVWWAHSMQDDFKLSIFVLVPVTYFV